MASQPRGQTVERLPTNGRPSGARVRPVWVARPGWSARLVPSQMAHAADAVRAARRPGQSTEGTLGVATGRGRIQGRRGRAGRGAGRAQPSPRQRAGALQSERQEARAALP